VLVALVARNLIKGCAAYRRSVPAVTYLRTVLERLDTLDQVRASRRAKNLALLACAWHAAACVFVCFSFLFFLSACVFTLSFLPSSSAVLFQRPLTPQVVECCVDAFRLMAAASAAAVAFNDPVVGDLKGHFEAVLKLAR
jgi:hypothetical protein